MKKRVTSAKGSRRYDNSLRAEQAQQTRERILGAALEYINDPSAGDLSMGKLAKRAGVSEPTVYRNFANRQALFDAMSDWVVNQLEAPEKATSLRELSESPSMNFRYFDENSDLIRASLTVSAARDFRVSQRRRRLRDAQKVLDPITDHLPKREARAIAAVCRLLHGSSAWLSLTDEYELTSEEGGDACTFVLRALLDRLRRDNKASKRAAGRS